MHCVFISNNVMVFAIGRLQGTRNISNPMCLRLKKAWYLQRFRIQYRTVCSIEKFKFECPSISDNHKTLCCTKLYFFQVKTDSVSLSNRLRKCSSGFRWIYGTLQTVEFQWHSESFSTIRTVSSYRISSCCNFFRLQNKLWIFADVYFIRRTSRPTDIWFRCFI